MDNEQTLTDPPCPACGSVLKADGSCTNEACPALQDTSGGQWEATDDSDLLVKTKFEWEREIGMTVPDSGFREDDGSLDHDRRYTREDFNRRAGRDD